LEKAFIDFVLSEEGQKMVGEMGYIKLVVTPAPKPTPKVAHTTAPAEAASTPAPTATPTPTPPGFEAVFAIAGLLAIAQALLRKK
ncbi:hypothetical protein C4E24_08785, partial [ANME-1 cluster archaeon AG-394-G21]|nr:hypothetical protein [ANME-1 cluster archaeon AG-394-G21]